jgi:hypothetical protein
MARRGRCAGSVDWRHMAPSTCHGRHGGVHVGAAQRPAVTPAPRRARPTRVRRVRRRTDVAARDVAAERAPAFPGQIQFAERFSNAIYFKF